MTSGTGPARALSVDDALGSGMLSAMLAASADGLAVVSTGGDLVWLNPTAASLLGVAGAGEAPLSWEATLPAESAQAAMRALSAACSGETAGFVLRPAAVDGVRARPQVVSLWPIHAADGAVQRVLCVMRPAPELFPAERESRLLQALSGVATICAWDWDFAADRVYCEGLLAPKFGVDAARAVGGVSSADYLAAAHADDRALFEAAVEKLRADGGDFLVELRILQPDGDYVWLMVCGYAVRDAQGRIGGARGATVDISGLRRAERARETVEERLSLALNASGMAGVWDWDLETDVMHGNGGFGRVNGVSPAFFRQGMTAADFLVNVHPEDKVLIAREVARLGQGVDELSCELRVLQEDESLRWLFVHGRAVRDASGKAVRLRGSAADITDRKRLEQRQALLLQELDHRVKNALAMIQVVVSQAVRSHATMPEAAAAVSARIAALSQAHDQLIHDGWDSTDLRAVLEGVARVYGGGEGTSRVTLAGPAVTLGSDATLCLTLAFHEMGANALKHGALSAPGGHVDVAWTLEGEGDEAFVRLRWRERGGPPPVSIGPAGFGAKLITRSFNQLGARVRQDYPPAGLIFTAETPLKLLTRA